MKRGLTLIEVVISMAVLGVIIAAVVAVFGLALKEYNVEKTRNEMQRNINFATDEMGNLIKQSINLPASYDAFVRSPETLILELPSINSDEEYLYNGSELRKDYVIYYLSGTELHKATFADPTSSRYAVNGSDNVILRNISNLNCDYSPLTNTESVDCNLTLSQVVYGTTVEVTAQKTAIKRNRE